MRLDFRELDVTDLGSLAEAVRATGIATGIYWITFEDGTEYVGQGVNLAARLSTHRRKPIGRMKTVKVAPVAVVDLDDAERYWIAVRDGSLKATGGSAGLRNKLITDVPGGLGDVAVTISPGVVIPLPWDRAWRGRVPQGWAPDANRPTPTATQDRQWARLQAHEAWPDLQFFLHDFLSETMSSPHLTRGCLWTVSAYPNTSRLPGWRRMCTLNVGKIEALYVADDARRGTVVCWNLALPDRRELAGLERVSKPRHVTSERLLHYSFPVRHLEVVGLHDARSLMRREVVKDLAYRFNTRCQREGMALQGRWHNWDMAAAIL